MVGRRFKSTSMNEFMYTTPSLPWWSPIRVQTEVNVPNFNERASELALVAAASL